MSPPLQPDGRDSGEKAMEVVTKAYKERSDYFEWMHIKYDGSLILVEALLTPITINNEVLVHVIWRDLTEVKNQQLELEESEQKYKALFDDSGNAMLIIDGRPLLHIVWRDITEQKKAEARIKKLAYEDTLTGFANRRTLVQRLLHVLDVYKRTHHKGALLFIDLDHFKNINDTLGHDVGDQVLKQVAERLIATVRTAGIVSRFGGDEFVIMLEDLDKDSVYAANKAELACSKLLFELSEPYEINGKELFISASIGVSMYTEDSEIAELLQQSDIAMYQAKASGRNAIRFFDPAMQKAIDERAATEQLIKDGLSNNLFELHYQLQVNEHGDALGVEALLRLKHPEQGFVPPMQYISVAEETGLILHIGNFVLETACKQLKLWEGNPNTDKLSIAVNVSPLEFQCDSFVQNVLGAFRNHDINASLLKLELTETMLVDDVDDIILKMNLLKENGIQFSMDDFGTGYSSLQYLRQLPLDQLKIDQSFVRDLEHDEQDRSIVQTIIVMGQALDLDVIAEGVETTEQQRMLLGYGCGNYQGYLFAKPMPIAEVERQILKGSLKVV